MPVDTPLSFVEVEQLKYLFFTSLKNCI